MQNSNKFPYRCCTYYNKQGYDEGYLMLPIFRVRVCRNCGECQAVLGLGREHPVYAGVSLVLGWKSSP